MAIHSVHSNIEDMGSTLPVRRDLDSYSSSLQTVLLNFKRRPSQKSSFGKWRTLETRELLICERPLWPFICLSLSCWQGQEVEGRSFSLSHTNTRTLTFSVALIFIYYFLCCFNDADDVCSTSSVSARPLLQPQPRSRPACCYFHLCLLRTNYWHLCRSPAIIFGLLNQPQQLRRQNNNKHPERQPLAVFELLINFIACCNDKFVFFGFCFDHLLRLLHVTLASAAANGDSSSSVDCAAWLWTLTFRCLFLCRL